MTDYNKLREKHLKEFAGGYYVSWQEYDDNVNAFYNTGEPYKTKEETAKAIRNLQKSGCEDIELSQITPEGNYPKIDITEFLKDIPEDNEQASTQVEKKYFDTLSVSLINKLLGEFYNRRRKRDGRGLIDVSDAYKAVCACVDGHLTDKDIKKYINTLFKMKYITYKNTDGYVQLFIAFKDVTTDESGKVIGVRW